MLRGKSWQLTSSALRPSKHYAAAVDVPGVRVAIPETIALSRFRVFEREVHNETNTTTPRSERSVALLSSARRGSSEAE
jgi:hypothetical protein